MSPRGPSLCASAESPLRLSRVKPHCDALLKARMTRPRRAERSIVAASGLDLGAGSRAGTGGRLKKEATGCGGGGGGGGGKRDLFCGLAAAASVTAAAAEAAAGGDLAGRRCERA